MRLQLSNGDYIYVQQNNIKLVDINGDINIVGNDILYGITENGVRYRLNPEISTTRLEIAGTENRIIDAIYDPVTDTYDEIYGDVPVWNLTTVTLNGNIPISMNANDTFNFDCFNATFLLTFILAIFVSFRVFNR